MSTPQANRRHPTDYQPLLELVGPGLYRENAFRLAGLPTHATQREITRQAERIKMLEKVGVPVANSNGFLPLELVPDAATVRESIRQLQKDPERRLIEEFFWFWPLDKKRNTGEDGDPLLAGDIKSALPRWTKEANENHDAISIHNLAVFSHVIALDLEHQNLAVGEYGHRDLQWQFAYGRWNELLDHDEFWNLLGERIHALDDPRLTTGVGRRIRESLPLALLLINGRLAVKFAEVEASDEVARQIRLIQGSQFENIEIEEALRRSTASTRERIKTLCRAAEQRGNDDPANAHEAVRRLLEQSREPLKVISSVLPSGNLSRNDICDEVALTSLSCQISYANSTSDWDTILELGELSLAIAASPPAKSRIQKTLKTLKENISGRELEKLAARIGSVVNSPTTTPEQKFSQMKRLTSKVLLDSWNELVIDDESKAFVMNLCARAFRSIAIDLHNDQQEFGLAYEAIEMASRYCLDSDLSVQISKDTAILKEHAGLTGSRFRSPPRADARVDPPGSSTFGHSDYLRAKLAQNQPGSWKSESSRPLPWRNFLSWRLLIGAIVVVVIGLNLLWLSNSSTPSNANSDVKNGNVSTALPSLASTATPKSAVPPPLSLRNDNSTRSLATPDSESAYTRPLESSNNSDTQIKQLRNEIEAANARLNAMELELSSLKSQLQNYDSQLQDYKSRIDANETTIKRMSADADNGFQVDRYRYNRLVSQYKADLAEHNSIVERYNSVLNTQNAKLALYKELADETNEKVRQYNSLIKSR